MYKGLVFKTTAEYALVLTEDRQYLKIRCKKGLAPGQKIFFLEEDLIGSRPAREEKEEQKRFRPFPKSVGAVLAAALLCCVFLGGLLIPKTADAAYGVLSVDINPSIELSFNQAGKVTAVHPLNQDGYLIAGQDLVGDPLGEAIASIILEAEKNHFLTEKDPVLIAAAVKGKDKSKAENRSEKLLSRLAASELPDPYQYFFLSSDRDTYDRAKANEVSLGKYQAALLSEGEIAVQDAKNMKVQEILADAHVNLNIKEYSQEKLRKKENALGKDKDKDKNKKQDKKSKADKANQSGDSAKKGGNEPNGKIKDKGKNTKNADNRGNAEGKKGSPDEKKNSKNENGKGNNKGNNKGNDKRDNKGNDHGKDNWNSKGTIKVDDKENRNRK